MAGGIIWDDEQRVPAATPGGVIWDTSQPDLARETARAASMRERPDPSGWYERYVAGPATGVARRGFEAAGALDVASGIKTPEQAAERAEMYSEFVIPQTGIEAGALAGTIAAPVLLPARAAAKLGPKMAPILSRILFGAGGGELGGEVTGETPGKGALIGGGTNVAGEVASTAGSKLLRSLPWMKGLINRMDAKRIGNAVGDISPPLSGAKKPMDFQELIEERGLPALGTAKEDVLRRVEGMLPGRQGPPWTADLPPGSIRMPSLGTRELPFDASKPAGMSLREANAELSKIGDMLHGDIPLDPRFKDRDLKKLYGELTQEISRGLEASGGPAARAEWEAGQAAYRKGRAVYDVLRQSKVLEQGSGAGNPIDDLAEHGMLNVVKLQRLMMDPDVAAGLRKALGPGDFNKFSDAVFRGAKRGAIDRTALGSGAPFDALATIGRGQQSGAWSLPVALGRIFLPNVGAHYVGRPPLTLPSRLQSILDVALQRTGGAALDPEARR